MALFAGICHNLSSNVRILPSSFPQQFPQHNKLIRDFYNELFSITIKDFSNESHHTFLPIGKRQ